MGALFNNSLSHMRLQGADALRIIRPPRGGIAQLGERLHGMQEVSGSIPLTSTNLDAGDTTEAIATAHRVLRLICWFRVSGF